MMNIFNNNNFYSSAMTVMSSSWQLSKCYVPTTVSDKKSTAEGDSSTVP